MSDAFLGEIRTTAFNIAPKGWAFCNGQMMSVNSNQALYALIGVTYGGDGRTTFALPNLIGRALVNAGPSASSGGLPVQSQGQMRGQTTAQLLIPNMPSHTHSLASSNVSPANQSSPVGNVWAQLTNASDGSTVNEYAPVTNPVPMPLGLFGTGGNVPFSTVQPTIVLNFIICTAGLFPSRS